MTTLHAGPLAAAAVAVRPSPRQLAWQATEFYGFLHFGMNTMTDREWGLGHEDPALFDPADVDTDQWMAALVAAGMRGVILTAKHHDGFCLWPSAFTDHSVAFSPWRGGRGDLVHEVADAARRHGLRLGLYLSPWDRTEATYGTGAAYDDFFVAQLRELLTGYGELFSVWFDGANGEGPAGRRQTYDWERYHAEVRRWQPDAVINVCGPDVRWCGNEAGHTRADEWSVVPRELQDAETIASRSQQVDDGTFATRVRSDDQDLGSRAAVAGREQDLVWYPAEVNTSIRPGWFHHPAEDDAVRPAEELLALHESSVGGNACFLLNVPPAADGRIGAADVRALTALGDRLADLARRVVAPPVTVSSGQFGPSAGEWPAVVSERAASADVTSPDVLPPANGTGWWRAADDDPTPTLTLHLGGPVEIEGVVVKEEIAVGQRIESVRVTGLLDDAAAVELAAFGVVGYQRRLTFPPVTVDRVVIEIEASRAAPVVAAAAVIVTARDPR